MPKRMLDQILIIDVEATCWDGLIPEGQESEIIEIGLCLLEIASGKRHSKRSVLVCPECSEVSPFCKQLTGLTQERVEQGMLFTQACALLQSESHSHQRVWASYGDSGREHQIGSPAFVVLRVPSFPFLSREEEILV